MDEEIKRGSMWEDRDGLARYVIQVIPAAGRSMARVRWRRPGAYADRVHTQTISAFKREVTKPDLINLVSPAPALPNNGMAEGA